MVLTLPGGVNLTWSGQEHPADSKSGNKSGFKGQSHQAGLSLQPTEPTLILNKEIFQKDLYTYSQTVQKISLFDNGMQLQYREHHRHQSPNPNPVPNSPPSTMPGLPHIKALLKEKKRLICQYGLTGCTSVLKTMESTWPNSQRSPYNTGLWWLVC